MESEDIAWADTRDGAANFNGNTTCVGFTWNEVSETLHIIIISIDYIQYEKRL